MASGMENVTLRSERTGRRVGGTSVSETDGVVGALKSLATSDIRLRKGDALFRAGDRLTAVYAVRIGVIKTITPTESGCERVTGFHLPGDLIGIEGLGTETHDSDAFALDYGDVGVIPISAINERALKDESFHRKLFRLLSSEIVRERDLTLMMGIMRAEQRIAWFLLALGARYARSGFSSTELILRMSREEIGSHLGLKLETVSRLLSRFAEERFIGVNGRTIQIFDRLALQELVHPTQ
jgi:CRP/FNR family transcriptional regulator